MQPRQEKKDKKLNQVTKINKALKNAPSIIVGNVGDNKNPATESNNPTVPPPAVTD